MPGTTAATDLEITLADGATTLGLMLVPPTDYLGQPREGWPRTVSERLSAASGDSPISQDLKAVVQEDFSGGVGIDYNWAPGVYTRTPGYAMSAGAQTPFQVPLSTHSSNTPLNSFAEYGGDLWIGQYGSATAGRGGRVLRSSGGSGALTESLTLAASLYVRHLLVADDGAGTSVLFASVSDADGLNGLMYKWDGASWTHSGAGDFGTNGRQRMAVAFWTTSDGNKGYRIVVVSGPNKISYTLPNADPLLAASYVEGVKIATTGSLGEVASFRRHAYFDATDDIWDVDELANSNALTSYLQRMPKLTSSSAIEHLNGYVYKAVKGGIIRVYVGSATLSENPTEGWCSPGWKTAARNEGRGECTAMCIDQGYLVAAIYNPTTQRTYIYWGIDRDIVGIKTPNPLVWYGPEVLINADYKVTRMVASGLAGDNRLWIGSQSVAGLTPRLDWISLPIAGSPLDDLVSGGAFRVTSGATGLAGELVQPYSRLELLPDSRGDKAQNHILYQHTIGSEGPLGPGGSDAHLRLYARADPTPSGSTAWVDQGFITTSPTQDVTPATVVAGHKMQLRIDFFNPNGAAPAVLDSIRTLAWHIAPSLLVKSLPVQYGDGVPDRSGNEDTIMSPDEKTAALKLVTEAMLTTIRDPNNQSWTVKVHQILDGSDDTIVGGTWGKRVTKTLVCSVIAGPL